MADTVFVAVETDDAGDSVFGVFTTREAAISALRTHSSRGLGDSTIVTMARDKPDLCWLHNPPPHRPGKQWVGWVSERSVVREVADLVKKEG